MSGVKIDPHERANNIRPYVIHLFTILLTGWFPLFWLSLYQRIHYTSSSRSAATSFTQCSVSANTIIITYGIRCHCFSHGGSGPDGIAVLSSFAVVCAGQRSDDSDSSELMIFWTQRLQFRYGIVTTIRHDLMYCNDGYFRVPYPKTMGLYKILQDGLHCHYIQRKGCC